MIAIRRIEPSEFDLVWPMLQPVFAAGDTYAVDPRITQADACAYWIKSARSTYLAEADGQRVGTFYIRTNQPGGGAHICNCGYVVADRARGQGVAERMCIESQRLAHGFGYTAMQFNFVLASNTGALRLWHRLGFVTVGTIPAAFDHPTLGFVDAHVLHKSLI